LKLMEQLLAHFGEQLAGLALGAHACRGCSLAILETHCGRPQEPGVSQS
jgi:hypothetical protein